MTLTNSALVQSIANTQHPHFVGLAQLRSLLAHEDVASDPAKSDAVLDMIAVLLRQGTARDALETFYQMKKVCGQVCYLAQFRLRRWLEQQVCLRTGESPWQSVELGFADFRRLVQNCRRHEWESRVDAAQSWEGIEVLFAWSGVPEVIDSPVSAELVA